MAIVPAQRIHAFHSAFGPSFSPAAPISAAQASSFTHLPNISVASSRGRGGRALQAAAFSFASGARGMSRTTQRRPPPPPPVRTAIACEEDPFADGPLVLVTQYARPPRSAHPAPPAPAKLAPAPVIASRTRIAAPSGPPSAREETKQAQSTAGVAGPPGIIAAEVSLLSEFPDVRGRLVANVLLSRRCGRPMRRRPCGLGESREYVKSGLSRVVVAEA